MATEWCVYTDVVGERYVVTADAISVIDGQVVFEDIVLAGDPPLPSRRMIGCAFGAGVKVLAQCDRITK